MKQFTPLAAIGLAAMAPGFAQAQTPVLGPVTGYGTVGYAGTSQNTGFDFSAVQARLGARLGPYFGVEGELSLGFDRDKSTAAGLAVDAKLRNQTAAYAVGYYPLTDRVDLLARIGYGQNQIHYGAGPATTLLDKTSVNYGVGGQYRFTLKDGMRVDYTRRDYRESRVKDDVLAVSYVRAF